MMTRIYLLFCLLFGVFVTMAAETVSLNGVWDFKCISREWDVQGATFFRPDASLKEWSRIDVPSTWESKGFGAFRYEDISGESGLYRRLFEIPSSWPASGRIRLVFGGVMFGARVWVNGGFAGDFTSSFTENVLDVTDLVRRDGANLLAVRTHGNPLGGAFDTHDDWTLHGIFRDVELVWRPDRRVESWRLLTKVSGADADVRVTSATVGEGTVRVRLVAPDGREVASATGEDVRFTVRKAALWTAETPSLYTLEIVALDRAGVAAETVREKVGLREVTWSGRVLKVNGRPVKLRGVNHHDLSPDNGRAVTKAEQWRDAGLIKAANCNLVRMCHYPPSKALLDACDELGLYVINEIPFGFGDDFLMDDRCRPILEERVRLTLARDINRACVIIWNVGNENPVTEPTRAVARLVKALDSTRPWCFPMQPHYFVRRLETQGSLDVGDLVNWHYPILFGTYAELRSKWFEKFDRPYLFGEYAHAYGVESGLLERYWDSMWRDGACAGGAIWTFQDQGVVRRAEDVPPEEREELVWPDAARVWDSKGNKGTDGIVYSDRTPQSDYYEVRKVYAPVRVLACDLSLPPDNHAEWKLSVENRHDHLHLSEGLTGRWTVRADGKAVVAGSFAVPSVPPHGRGDLAISADIPEAAGGALWLEVSFACRRTGRSVSEQAFPLRVRRPHPAGKLRLDVDRATGRVKILDADGCCRVDSPLLAHVDRRRMIAKGLTTWRDDPWLPGDVAPTRFEIVEATESSVVVKALWTPTNAAPDLTEGGTFTPSQEKLDALTRRELRGTVRMTVDGGLLSVDYELAFAKPRTVTELGLGLQLAADQVAWVGRGPYECYPESSMLSEFGIWTLHRDDLYFAGNRREVTSAIASLGNGLGLAFAAETPADFVFGRKDGMMLLGHNALVAGKGGKFTPPLGRPELKAGETVRGRFDVCLSADAEKTATPFRPFWKSYDE